MLRAFLPGNLSSPCSQHVWKLEFSHQLSLHCCFRNSLWYHCLFIHSGGEWGSSELRESARILLKIRWLLNHPCPARWAFSPLLLDYSVSCMMSSYRISSYRFPVWGVRFTEPSLDSRQWGVKNKKKIKTWVFTLSCSISATGGRDQSRLRNFLKVEGLLGEL